MKDAIHHLKQIQKKIIQDSRKDWPRSNDKSSKVEKNNGMDNEAARNSMASGEYGLAKNRAK